MANAEERASVAPWSAEARVLVHPATTFRTLKLDDRGGSPLRGPALLLLFLGCAISFLASGRPGIRLIADGAVSFAFVPFCELAGLAAALRVGRRRVPFSRAIDPFFTGNAPWLLWIVILSLASTVSRPIVWTHLVLAASAVPPAIWSAIVDFHFFREIADADPRAAARGVVVHRVVAWSLATTYFFGIAIWPEVAGRLG
jgi:hypothetical protein